ncbi:hypothetical protein C7999DRAFT_33505 [Corynascus novoguineensis]|uniref:BTB domain-containing protein n=1 Tax=Corynascus novoguineensis TaxID=1126955 RepID=A0AAN7HLW2_9PEZI|nr:hypothetical protein C7999DRAFT_33505 [Corynascus novoguineensis]
MVFDTGSPDIKIFDPHGDLRLIVGEHEAVFQVCSRTLARSSPVWDTFLYGPFSRSKAQQNSEVWEVSLPGDDADGLSIILWAIHYNLGAFPLKLTLDLLFRITVLADKYDMIGTLRPFWGGWLRESSRAFKDEDEPMIEQICISHILGAKANLVGIVADLIDIASVDDAGQPVLPDAKGLHYRFEADEIIKSLDILGACFESGCLFHFPLSDNLNGRF